MLEAQLLKIFFKESIKGFCKIEKEMKQESEISSKIDIKQA
jgi:hypothetical protein